MKRKRQKLMAVHVSASLADGASPAILPVGGGTIEELLAAWRVVQIQPLGELPGESAADGRYVALLLLEEIPPEDGVGRLGFAAP
jgi:hypothetical protein